MEVLVTDDKLRDEIINDAKTKADRIIKKAEREAETITQSSSSEINKYEEELKKTINSYIFDEEKRIFASVDIEVKKQCLKIIGDAIDDMFTTVKNGIITNKIMNYKEFMSKLIMNACESLNDDKLILEIGNREENKLTESEIKSLKLSKGSISSVSYKDKRAGYAIYSSDKKRMSFVSIDSYIDNVKQDNLLAVFELLSDNK